MTANAYNVTVADFDQAVLAASHSVPVLVDFWADWCQPCKILKPILEKLAAEYGRRFILAKVDSDTNQELAQRYAVRGIPAVKAFIDGAVVDEFTGALPESQVREFIDRLMPSPAAPLHVQALEAHRHGNSEAALELLRAAVVADPKFEAAQLDLAELCLDTGAFDEARQVLDAARTTAKDAVRIEALAARLQLAASAAGADIAALEQALAANPADLDSRLLLANALALAHDYRAAGTHLIDIVRRDRQWNDEAGRKTLLALFSLLGAYPEYDALVREFRIALARTLN